ncbi:MAG: riboflavin synthase [Deltaproteobacteria bacterium]
MFSGIIEDLGSVAAVEPLQSGSRLTIKTALEVGEIGLGDSIAVNGACMTAVAVASKSGTFDVDVSAESLRCTTLGLLKAGSRVNLERSIRMSDRLDGHLVSGHVDGTGSLRAIKSEGESSVYSFEVAADLMRLMVEKGSVAVDGISLTCFNCSRSGFDVAVIAHTASVTTLGLLTDGNPVNIENDLFGKYVAKLAGPAV